MTATLFKPRISFEEYVDVCAQTEERYELVRGELRQMNPPTVLHYRIAKFLERRLDQAIENALDPNQWEAFRDVGQRTAADSSRLPDVAIVAKEEANQLLNQTAVFQSPSLLVVEIVSRSSASEDYSEKLQEYQALQIPEYWIIDYAALGAAQYLGFPKQPTVTIHQLIDGVYQQRQFRGRDRIFSPIFPNLEMTAAQILNAGQ